MESGPEEVDTGCRKTSKESIFWTKARGFRTLESAGNGRDGKKEVGTRNAELNGRI